MINLNNREPIFPFVDPDNLDPDDPSLEPDEQDYVRQLLKSPKLQEDQRAIRDMLSTLQANILKGHDRDHAVLIFLHFNTMDRKSRKLKGKIVTALKKMIRTKSVKVTSALTQLEEMRRYRRHKIPGGTVTNLYLTAAGYRALGFKDNQLPNDRCFRAGINASANRLNDPETWKLEEPYRQDVDQDHIHAMILMTDDDVQYLGRQVRLILNEMLKTPSGLELARVVTIEHGHQLRDAELQPIEHFGFRDGLSNPLFLNTDRKQVGKYGGDSRWRPWAPLNLILTPEPSARKTPGYGSFLVYRKLEQNVPFFNDQIRNLGLSLSKGRDEPTTLERARALVVGRFSEGTPLTLEKMPYLSQYNSQPNYNNFTYDDDPTGAKCPFHAHIRKANPRNDDSRDRRIVRRGITYGERNLERERQGLQAPPAKDVGLLFMCFQADIALQFEFIQSSLNNPDLPEKKSGIDPISGQTPGRQSLSDLAWPRTWGNSGDIYKDIFNSCVSLKGGEYFFAPSISFLKNIAS